MTLKQLFLAGSILLVAVIGSAAVAASLTQSPNERIGLSENPDEHTAVFTQINGDVRIEAIETGDVATRFTFRSHDDHEKVTIVKYAGTPRPSTETYYLDRGYNRITVEPSNNYIICSDGTCVRVKPE